MESDGTSIVTVKDYEGDYDKVVEAVDGIRETRGVKYQLDQLATNRAAITTDCTVPIAILKSGKKTSPLAGTRVPCTCCPQTYLPIKRAKYDVRSLLTHIHTPDCNFLR